MPAEPNPASLPAAFRDVDAAPPDHIVRCLDTLQAMPAGRAYKALALDALGLTPGMAALDVACGLGDDVARMAERCGRAVGADASRTLLDRARVRHPNGEFVAADAAALPFPDATFDAVRIDRSLQHIADPGRVVREMARVARPGGVVLCAEPDWGTFLIGGPHSALTERMQHDWVRTFRNPWIGRDLSPLLAAAGVHDRRAEGVWLPTHGFAETDLLFEVEVTARRLAGAFPDAPAWLDAYRAGEASAGVLILVVWGRKA